MMPFAFYMELLWLGIFFLGRLSGVGHGGVFGVVVWRIELLFVDF